ncbi:MAG: gamma-glutamyltransferase [Betaproteobacteria bacterium]|nr:gamma-glutamyltransferase [Betaproteobacteria bacterium]
MRARQFGVVLLVLCIALAGAARAATSARAGAAIASAHPLATEAGREMLRLGGNAFDAAVAVAAALAVVEPYSSGLGGGGFWLLHRARDGRQVMLDARETAPAKVAVSQYLDAAGKPIPAATLQGGTAVGIPGVPAGIVLLAQKYGRLKLAQSLAPAIMLARNGFRIDPRYARVAKSRERFLINGVNTARTFLDNQQAPQPGYLLRQPQLAATLALIAREGRNGFYRGRVAQILVTAVNAVGGVWLLSDLENYRAVERVPIKFNYRGATIVTAALPSAGGITLAQALNILEQFQLTESRNPATAHLVAEALRRGFQDRALYLGDSDFVKVPIAKLIDKQYARRRAATINPAAASTSDTLETDATMTSGSGNTTHYSIIDSAGNRVSATLSINTLFGAGIIAGDTGVLLNNEMDDFSLRPEIPNAYRLRSGAANAIAPGKRPLSSMTPTFVEDGKGVLVIGAPGGSRIISMVLLGILDYLSQREVDLNSIVTAPRYHHQYWPDRIEIEPDGFSAEWRSALQAKGHKLEMANRKWGNMQVVFKTKTGATHAVSDPRGSDVAGY